MDDQQKYLAWQTKLAAKKLYRRFWQFWALYSVAFVFAAGLYLLVIGQYKILSLAVAAFVLGRFVISPLIYIFYKKARPYQAFKFITAHSWLMSRATTKSNSFPSDHAVGIVSVAAVVIYFLPALGIVLFVVAFLNGWARIILGYHYLLDILAGWAVGILSAGLVIYLSFAVFTH